MRSDVYEKLRSDFINIYACLERELSEKGKNINHNLKLKFENLKRKKFLLAVMGEVKAGKSTFINALLGKEILPTGIGQTTSAIIEIFKSQEEFVRVTFADGHVEEMRDDPETPDIDEAVEYLKKLASISEETRSLPVIQLNDFLIKKYSRKKKRAVFTENELHELISEVSVFNLYDIPMIEFERQIKEYLQRNISLSEIPAEVSIGYPLEWEFENLVLVDTPGVNACGGIENITYDFIERANGIIYLHNAPPIESKTLSSLIKETIASKNKDCTMLVLSNTAKLKPDDRNLLLEEARKIFTWFNQDNFFAVDSLTELYKNQFIGNDLAKVDVDKIIRSRKENRFFRCQTAYIWEESNGNANIFRDLIEKQANFKDLKSRINFFSEQAGIMQLKELIEIAEDNLNRLS
jgi:GTPase SAR1 family protein